MRKIQAPLVLAAFVAACAPAVPPAPPPPPPAPAATAPAVAAPPEPKVDPEAEKKKAELEKLAKDLEAMEAAAVTEAARFDEALKAEAKALAEARYPNLKAALRAAMTGRHRAPGNADRDAHRRPVETLEFFGVKPTTKLLEVGAGGGWYTELLAPALAKGGKLVVTGFDPAGPDTVRSSLYGRRLRRFLDKAPEIYGKIEVITLNADAPSFGLESKVDVAVAIREMHGWHRNGKMDIYLAEVRKALVPGGIFGVVQHRAKPDANPDESAKQGYLPEAWVIEKVEAAGFKLAGKSEVNANPKDTKDYAEGVWTLPPSFRLKDQDRAKYAEIGESDRMTLKFQKPR